ncbi:hypothetical protein KNO15_10745 [Leifsonia shinshuensis]|uniref:hypothetical protein n=1 Tax=Leifsonia shinshuensis TaxID=150026 RepID=UPI001F504EC4|nr:hypothetical protein [Leifsonia shinshuensis]MCI0157172.1 hypothetical protein [Leifsonia shinshuensis]
MGGALDSFDDYTRRVETWARADHRVLGIALLGSGADRSRIDEWSDHDLLVLALPEAVDELRADLSWLPDADRLVAVGREWHDGIKALFDDGRVLELGIADPAGLRSFPLAAAQVVYDAGPLAEGLEAARAGTRTREVDGPADAVAVLMVQLVVGVGRLRRGERLSGGQVVRGEAALTLVDLVLSRSGCAHPDPFDGWRRFETVRPGAAARLDAILARPAEEAARGILDLAEELLAPGWEAWPAAGVSAVRRRLWP